MSKYRIDSPWTDEQMGEILQGKWDKRKPYVFISYASRDKDLVFPTVIELRRRGFNVYIDTELQGNATQNWLKNVKDVLYYANCKGIIRFLSLDYLRSYACLIEQLLNLSKKMKKNRMGKALPVISVSLDDHMNSIQAISNYVATDAIMTESQDAEITMAPEECSTLQEMFLDCGFEDLQTAEDVKRDVDDIHNKHDIVVRTINYALNSPSLLPFSDVEKCCNTLQSNFVGRQNQDIQLNPLESLQQEMEAVLRAYGADAVSPAPEPPEELEEQTADPSKPRRGRPKGSKNKPKREDGMAVPALDPTPAPAMRFPPVLVTPGETAMQDAFDKILNEYICIRERGESIKGHPMYFYFQDTVPEIFYGTGIMDRAAYKVAGSAGHGGWSAVPWVCIFDRSITESAQRGVYIIYLFSGDGNSVYLTFNQGCTDLVKQYGGKAAVRMMRENTRKIRNQIDSRGFLSDDQACLGDQLTPLAQGYQDGIIFYKRYDKGAVPPELVLRTDLQKMMDIYRDYARTLSGGNRGPDFQPEAAGTSPTPAEVPEKPRRGRPKGSKNKT